MLNHSHRHILLQNDLGTPTLMPNSLLLRMDKNMDCVLIVIAIMDIHCIVNIMEWYTMADVNQLMTIKK